MIRIREQTKVISVEIDGGQDKPGFTFDRMADDKVRVAAVSPEGRTIAEITITNEEWCRFWATAEKM